MQWKDKTSLEYFSLTKEANTGNDYSFFFFFGNDYS